MIVPISDMRSPMKRHENKNGEIPSTLFVLQIVYTCGIDETAQQKDENKPTPKLTLSVVVTIQSPNDS